MAIILETRGLKKVYGSGETAVHALRKVNIKVEKGEFVAVVGTSGSGKSTLLHMLGGLDRPTEGEVYVDGKSIFSLKDEELTIFRRRKIGFIFQSYNLIPTLNVYDNIVLPIQLNGDEPNEKYVDLLIRALGIANKLDSLPNNLSGGQQQRVAIARALAADPEIIFFDEPTSALDPELTGEVLSVMRQLAEEGMTMLVVTHEMGFARTVSNQVVFMEDGVVVEAGPSHKVFEDPREERTRAFLQLVGEN